jgi:TetR/AcrR family transcriptional repressor of nem operon
MTGMAEKVSHKAKTRARILDEAAKALRSGGTSGISVAALMKRAGLTHGGFYAHFASRDDLVAHAIDRMFEDSGRMLDRFLGASPGATGLADLIDHYLSERAMQTLDRGCPLPGLSGEVMRMPEAARARFEQGITTFQAALTAALSAMSVAEPDVQARSVLSEMVGALMLARAMSDTDAARSHLAAARQSLKQRLGLSDPKTIARQIRPVSSC